VAREFDLHSNDKAGSGERPPRRAAIPFEAGQRGRNDFRPIDSPKVESAGSWPGFWPRSLAGAGPAFLLGIALLCTLYPSLNNKKSIATNTKADDQPHSDPTSQPSQAVQPLTKPSTMPERASHARSGSPGFPAMHDHPMKYEATRKKAFGGCTGQLELTSAALHFRCSHQADLDIPVNSIAGTHKDGVVLESGEKYHFLIANHSKGQVEMIFNLWLNRVRQVRQASRESSF
jgi:hypothetical protein